MVYSDMNPDYSITGSRLWSELIQLTLQQLAYVELRMPWLMKADFRRYLVQVHIYLSGLRLGRNIHDQRWQPELRTFEHLLWIHVLT